jgi:hypothetical protein
MCRELLWVGVGVGVAGRMQKTNRDRDRDQDHHNTAIDPSPFPTPQTPAHLPTTLTQLQIQEQADKLLPQASEIGLSVLSHANASWKEGKERARGIYEEWGGAGAGGERNRSGRGGLMMDGNVRDMDNGDADGWGTKGNAREGAFVDDGERDQRRRQRPLDTRTSRPTTELEPPQEAVGDLFGDADPSTTTTTTTTTITSAYVSPFRRTKPTPSPFWIRTSGVLIFYYGTP